MFRRMAILACLLGLIWGLAGCRRTPSDPSAPGASGSPSDQFLGLMNAGKNHLDQGDATNALTLYRQAEALVPNDADLRLNLANAYLLAGAATEAIRESEQVLRLEPNSAAAYFVKGSAHLRLANPEEAVKAFENVQKIDPGERATCFQLGKARMELKQWEAAITAFREGLAMDPNRLHTAAHYLLGQALIRAGRPEEAQQQFQHHQSSLEVGGPATGAAAFERSKYTVARVPFRLDQPDPKGIRVTFVEATQAALGEAARTCSGPIGLIDLNRNGWNSLFVLEKGQHFRLLQNQRGTFAPQGASHPALPGARYARMLVGDLQNDRFEDILVLGDQGSHLFQFATNGVTTDVAEPSGLRSVRAVDGALMDLDFTGKLDLLVVTSPPNEVRLLRQFGALLFRDITRTSGIPATLRDAQSLLIEDWNRDGNMDVIVSRKEGALLELEKQRGGPLAPRELPPGAAGAVFCTGDFDNDLRPDLAVVSDRAIHVGFNGGATREIALPSPPTFRKLVAVDYDADGWLDLWAAGDTVRVWRNRGLAGFEERTAQVGLDQFAAGAVSELHFADFDLDCDSDLIVALAGGGLRYLRNDGGNRNTQVKVRLFGNRSNASGIGCKVEMQAGGLRLLRTVQQLPVEIGLGQCQQLDSFLVHWFNWPQGGAQVPVHCQEPLLALELSVQEGSCPYLYAWDGQRFRFVTDILGAAPLGLPVAEGVYTDADPEELVWIGNDRTFPPRDGHYQLQITEELREVLYLDEAKLVVVDHDPETEVHSTDKLLPAKPFPPGALLTLHRERPLLLAETLEGRPVTPALKSIDGHRVSPPRVRIPQLRGLAEPHGVILDFGPLDTTQPFVLVLNGWLRFGGGMANIAASHDPSLPFPFPALEAEVAPGGWKPVSVTVGAPAGKTKTILVDLENKLAPGTRRFRLTTAFEIHWDRIALMEKQIMPNTRITFVAPTEAQLYFRGFSALEPLPPDWPLTPDFDAVSVNSFWTLIPRGWCTRYGDVAELVAVRDEGLALINAGDALSLKFATHSLPPPPPGQVRDFFLYSDGWDKDSDFHVAEGTRVEPLPFHGMNDRRYGQEPRPPFPSDVLHRQYHTRWVEGKALRQTVQR